LYRVYWFPLYAYVRRRGYSREDAEDLTQAFFEKFLAKNYLESLSAERGRFRAFLLASMKHFIANQWDKSQSQKRGGGAAHLPLDWATADTQFRVATTAQPSAEMAFDREWAVALLSCVIQRLRDEFIAEGALSQFDQLRIFLTGGSGEISYVEVAKSLQMEETAVRVAVHRLRKRYRTLLRREIAQTLLDPAQADEEMRSLFKAFGDSNS
jgi:DNA-directed RNA polymerase specialized sigma24 family protein